MSLDTQTAIGSGIVGFFGLAGAAWAWLQRQKIVAANTKTEVSMSAAERTLYEGLRTEIATLRGEMAAMRAELEVERRAVRVRDRHIAACEALLVRAGINPPEFHEVEPA